VAAIIGALGWPKQTDDERGMLRSGGRRPWPWRWPAALRRLSRLAPPTPAPVDPAVVRVDRSNVARLGAPKPGPRPRQLLSLPPFPAGADPLPGRKVAPRRVTAVSWVKHYFADVPQEAVQAHFNRRMVTFCTGIPTRCRSVSKGGMLWPVSGNQENCNKIPSSGIIKRELLVSVMDSSAHCSELFL